MIPQLGFSSVLTHYQYPSQPDSLSAKSGVKPKALSLHRFSKGKTSRIAWSSTKLNHYFFLDRFASNETCTNLIMFRHAPGTPRSRGTVIHSLLKKRHLPLQSSFIYTNTSDNCPAEKEGLIHFPGGLPKQEEARRSSGRTQCTGGQPRYLEGES